MRPAPPIGASRFARHRLLAGVVLGVVLTLAFRVAVNKTPVADWLADPLMMSDTPGTADVIVVLTAGMTGRCTPNLQGLRRVLLAAELYAQHRAPSLLVSGAGGQVDLAGCTVGGEMRALLEKLGVPADRIRLETNSDSTWANAERADAVLRVLGARRIVLVTDKPHMRRAVTCFGRYGYEVERAGVPVFMAHRDNMELLVQSLREYLALASYGLRGFMSDTPATPALVTPPAQREAAAGSFAAARREGPIVILGASYAKGWKPTIDGLTFVNRGVEGQQSFELAARFDADVIKEHARTVVLWGFVNDVFRTPRPDLAQALARVRDSYTTMLATAEREGIGVVLATEVTMGRRAGAVEALMAFAGGLLGKQSYADYVNRHVMDTNEWLRELARQRGLPVLDFERALAGPSGLRRRPFTADDGSHLTPNAYDALTQHATPVLRQHLVAQ